MKQVRVRMAPSPTGYLHIGTARTALFNYLFARKHQGVFVLRIEDTDIERSRPEFEQDIMDGLRWLGITWDEGPDCGGPFGPYRQSERTERYAQYLRQVYETGHAYKCFCTEEELARDREERMWNKLPPVYSGRCRDLTAEEVVAKEAAGQSWVLRFRVPEMTLKVQDHIKGEISFETGLIGDFVIAKGFDAALYNFAVVVDDYEMEITHVIRGEDHISNIPKQMLIGSALGFSAPEFAHIPMILNQDRTKLSKRQNKVSLLEYRTEGFLPEALVNFMAFLGWNPGGERELFALSELVDVFDLPQVNTSGAIFDLVKLDWFNAHYIKQMDLAALTTLCIPHFVDAGYFEWSAQHDILPFVQSVVAVERERIKHIPEIAERVGFYFSDPVVPPELLQWKEMTREQVVASLTFVYEVLAGLAADQFAATGLETTLKAAITATGRVNGEVLWPLRVALTGLEKSPSPFIVAGIIGSEATLRRITAALSS